MKAKLRQILAELISLHGVSGFEHEVVAFIREKVKDYSDEVKVDSFGNIIALRRGSSDGNVVMIPAHMDEVGLIVRKVEETGLLRFALVGYPNPSVLSGRRVMVGGKYSAVVGARSWHYTPPEERERLPKAKDLFVDVGARSSEEIGKMGIGVGTPISFVSELEQLGLSDIFAGKAIDDRLGCATVLMLFEALASTDLRIPIYGCFTVQEEVGCRGAKICVKAINPKFALVLDAPIAEDTPDQEPTSQSSVSLGKGTTITLKEFMPDMLLGVIHHPAFVDYVVRMAESKRIPYQVCLHIGGTTDASAIHVHGDGVPTVWVGAPVRYAHSCVETFDINDAVGTVELLKEVVTSMTPDTKFSLI